MHYAITNVVTVQQDIDVAFGEAMRDPGAAIEFGGAIISKSMRHVVGAQKFSQVVMSPGNMLLNLSGSPMMALMNGIVSPARGVRAVNDASKALRADINIKWVQDTFSRERATELIETGSLDTASVGMLQSDAWQELRKTMLAQARRGETPSVYRAVWETGKEKGGTALAAIRNSYALVDVWVKVATYQKRKEFWTEFNRLENRGMSSEDIRRQAGWDASTTNVSYDRSIPLFRALERNTPFAVFATYFGEAMIRVPVMNMVQAYRDARLAQSATNPEAKILAAGEAFRRAVGTLIATQGVIWSTVAALSAEDDEDRAQRGLDPSWYQNSILVPLGTNKEGHPEYYALNRVDPIGPHNETIVGLIMADDKAQAVVDVMRDFFVPSSAFMSAWQLITDAVSGITGNRDLDKPSQKSSLKEAFPHAYEALTQFENDGDVPENFIALIERMYLPSAVKGIIEEERNVLGLYAYARDPVKSVGFRIMDYEKARNSMSREFRSYMEGDPDPDRVFQRMNQILNKEEEEFDKLAAAYQGLLASPVDPTDAMGRKFSPGHARTIFTDAGLGSLVRNLARQEFKSTILEPEVMERWYDREYRKKKTREERRKLAQSRRIWMLAYRDVMKERRENE